MEGATERGPGVSEKRGRPLPGRKWCLLAARLGGSSVNERGRNARQFVATVILEEKKREREREKGEGEEKRVSPSVQGWFIASCCCCF